MSVDITVTRFLQPCFEKKQFDSEVKVTWPSPFGSLRNFISPPLRTVSISAIFQIVWKF